MSPSLYDQEDLLALTFMAFGQGAGTMYATPAALGRARREYAPALRRETWDADAPLALEYARALGRVAAQLAASDGATAIEEAHLDRASELVRTHQVGPWFCPYCPPTRHPGDEVTRGRGPAR